ncbi:hypothetical protein B0H19DRAFT_878706, partial [Mycena capillaripes]
MIALCRAKCWIIQLRDEDSGSESNIPSTQHGVKGHLSIVYPQKPSAIAKSLPPSISDTTTPICVIFVGSQPPMEEVKPLIVRKERVLKALNWLKTHNHLYRDVAINTQILGDQPDEIIPPFHIQHIVPNAGIDSTTSNY